MNARQTIEDSKRAFLRSFNYVIPPLYRRVVDELLVELHLLSHKKYFKQNLLISIGIKTVFETFTRGYRPEQHLPLLFDALCKSGGVDSTRIKGHYKKIENEINPKTIEGLIDFLSKENLELKDGVSYERLMAIGLYQIIVESKLAHDPEQILKHIFEISDKIQLPKERVEKDIKIYISNIERLNQAVELMKEATLSEQRKKEQNTKANN